MVKFKGLGGLNPRGIGGSYISWRDLTEVGIDIEGVSTEVGRD